MTTQDRLTTAEENIERLINLNESVVQLIVRMDLRIEQNRLAIEQNERHIQQTQRLWIAVAKHFGLLDEIDFDTE